MTGLCQSTVVLCGIRQRTRRINNVPLQSLCCVGLHGSHKCSQMDNGAFFRSGFFLSSNARSPEDYSPASPHTRWRLVLFSTVKCCRFFCSEMMPKFNSLPLVSIWLLVVLPPKFCRLLVRATSCFVDICFSLVDYKTPHIGHQWDQQFFLYHGDCWCGEP